MTGLLGRSGRSGVPALLAAVCCSGCLLDSQHDFVQRVAFLDDGRWLFSTDIRKRTVVWRVDPSGDLERFDDIPGWTGAVTPEGQWLVVGANGSVGVWVSLDMWHMNERDRRFVQSLAPDDVAGSVTVSPDSEWAVSEDRRGSANVWRLAGTSSALASHEVLHPNGELRLACFSPDGRYLLTGSDDEIAKLWRFDPAAGAGAMLQLVATLESRRSDPDRAATFTSIAFSPDGRWICAAYDDVIAVWPAPVQERQFEQVLQQRTPHLVVKVVQFSPDGRWLLSAGEDGTARVWQFTPEEDDTAQLIEQAAKVVGITIGAAAFHPSGMRVALGTASGDVCLWNPFE